MSEADRSRAVLVLQLIAAQAAKLADDLEHGRLWEGDYSEGVATLSSNVRQLPAGR
jgi:hypothetical protein